MTHDRYPYLKPFNFDLCSIKLLEIEQFDHLTVYIKKKKKCGYKSCM